MGYSDPAVRSVTSLAVKPGGIFAASSASPMANTNCHGIIRRTTTGEPSARFTYRLLTSCSHNPRWSVMSSSGARMTWASISEPLSSPVIRAWQG